VLLAHRGRAVRFQDDSLLLFDDGSHSPEEVDAVLAQGRAVLDAVPPRLWARLRGDA
jgi:hypothetical protein